MMMPNYDYDCESCGFGFETYHSSKPEDFLEDCPACGEKKTLKIVYSLPSLFVKGEPTTVGLLAYRNTQKMGRLELEDKDREMFERRQAAIKSRKEMSPLLPGEHRQPEYQRPFWRKGDKIDTSLANLSPEKKEKYVMTGEK